MKKGFHSILFFMVCLNCLGQADIFLSGGRQSGMGNASLVLSDVYALQYNQAGLAFIDAPALAFAFQNRHIISGLNQSALFYAHPTKSGTFGLTVDYFGYQLYNETKVGLAYARKIGKKIALGIQLDYLRLFVSEGGSLNRVSFETGIIYKPLKTLSFGFHIYNPIPYKVSPNLNQTLPTIIKAGLGYHPSEKVTIIPEIEMHTNQSPNFKLGFEYKIHKSAQIRGGINTYPVALSLGFGSTFKNMTVDFAGAYNLPLGLSPTFSLGYNFRKPKKSND